MATSPLAAANERRQPVHTVYGGAQLFRADSALRIGARALEALAEHAPDARALAEAFGIEDEALASTIRERVEAKLRREPVEDLRIDFEDGFGPRGDEEEDAEAKRTAREAAAALAAGTLPAGLGIRIKSLSGEHRARGLRTLELFLERLAAANEGALPPGFVVTLPKIQAAEEVRALATSLDALEARFGLAAGAVAIELMVETPRTIFAADGRVALPALVAAGDGRVTGAHFGTYDYTAALGISAAEQRMGHPACDFAKSVMQVALAGSGVWLSDGATNVLPVGPYRRESDGAPFTPEEAAANRRAVHGAWRLHAADVRRSLVQGFYQGWDLHPAQLVSRYAALDRFFLEGLDAAAARLRNFVEQAARATLVGEVFDDAATGQGLLNHFLRAIGCGAIDEAEAEARTGLGADELATRSFPAILIGRGGHAPSPRPPR
jgi:citrate lyase beta subunit